MDPNPDIAGLGVILAFLITAWLSFIFLAIAYASGRMSHDYIRQMDRVCFRANSNKSGDDWKKLMDKVILVFSDQQLITGLAILIAAFFGLATNDLDTYHWQIVIYLAWMSSMVHLITLTFLRQWLSQRPLLRSLRLFGMLILFVLLVIAMYPQTYSAFVASVSSGSGWVPTSCFFNGQYNNLYNASQQEYVYLNNTYAIQNLPYSGAPYGTNLDLDDVDESGPKWNLEAFVSYAILFFGYSWRVSQAFNPSRGWIRIWLTIKPVLLLERVARRLASRTPKRLTLAWFVLKLVTFWFIVLVACIEVVQSFMTILFFLFLSLLWGTAQIINVRNLADVSVRQGENQLSFGQLLALLLLIQPLTTVVEHYTIKCAFPLLLHTSSHQDSLANVFKSLRDP